MDPQIVAYIFTLAFAIGVDSLPEKPKSSMFMNSMLTNSNSTPSPMPSATSPASQKILTGKSDKYDVMDGHYYTGGIPGGMPGGFPGEFGGSGFGLGLLGSKGLFDPAIILPIILIAGLGLLILPVIGTLFTSALASPVNTLVTGKRRRRHAKLNNGIHEDLTALVADLWKKVGSAFDKYSASAAR